MFKSISLAKITAAICLMIAAASAIASRPVANDPNWTFHSSFDNNPRKIIDTPDRVYFFVHQCVYNLTSYGSYYNIPSGAVLYIDKADMAGGIKDLRKTANLSGTDMRLFSVDPETGIIVIAYLDGGIDVITPDNNIRYISDIKKRSFPGANVINAISFDPKTHNAWIAAGDGFICISATSLEVIRTGWLGTNVSDICPVGDRVVAIIDGGFYEAPSGADVRRRESFTSIASVSSGIAGTPLRILPLGNTCFGYVTSTGAIIRGFVAANGKWDREAFKYDGAILQAQNISVADRLEQTVLPTKNGYYIASSANAYFLNRSATDGSAPTFITQSLPSGSTLYSASYDQKTFWFYRNRSEFISRDINNKSWSEPEVFTYSGPLVCKDVDFIYSPNHGFLSVNREPNVKQLGIDCVMSPLVTSFRNGKWTNLSPVHNKPYYADENQSFYNTWLNNRHLYPIGNPLGVAVDPVFPEYMHVGSTWCGVAAINIEDPRKYPILSTVPGYVFSAYPSQTDLPKQTWGTFTGSCCAGFDGDNVLWVFRNNTWNSNSSLKNDVIFRYWTPEARKAALESGDVSLAGNWKELSLPGEYSPEFWNYAKALRHPVNKGKLVAAIHGGNSKGRPLIIFDHKGTLENTSDDKFTYVYNVRLENGALMKFGYIKDLIENPLTGELLILAFTDSFIINPSDPITDGIIPGKILTFKSDFGSGCEFLSPLKAYAACYDEYGRLWIGGDESGIIGLNADRSELIAHYTTSNSPLPSNRIYGLGWNPETKSLFASTDQTILEIKVDNITGAPIGNGIQDPFLTPTVVRPDYTGTIAIHNIPKGATLKVTDANGKTVANIPDPEHGVAFWNLLDKDGRRVPTGLYKVSDATATTDFPTLDVVLTR